jgi:ubiquinone/menaquinone biosynthesis C-methylase UbiE
MADNDKVFAGSIPELYDQLMVPLIFEPYARDLADRLAKAAPKDVLETAAGTGVVTRAIAARLPADARITATDLNPPMLDRAKARQVDDKRITWQQADALALPFGDQSFDVVACQFGAMFFPDKVQGHKEARRVLRPGGRYIFNVWGDIAANDFADTVTQTMAEVFPQDPPRFLARTPHGHHDADKIRSELTAAGFADITIETVDAVSKASSPRDPAVAYCQGTPLRAEIEARGAPGLEAATEKAAQALAKKFGTGAIEGRIRAVVVTAVR